MLELTKGVKIKMQKQASTATPKYTCLSILKKISALRQLNLIDEKTYSHLIKLTRQAMENGNFNALLDFLIGIYQENPKLHQVSAIIDQILM